MMIFKGDDLGSPTPQSQFLEKFEDGFSADLKVVFNALNVTADIDIVPRIMNITSKVDPLILSLGSTPLDFPSTSVKQIIVDTTSSIGSDIGLDDTLAGAEDEVTTLDLLAKLPVPVENVCKTSEKLAEPPVDDLVPFSEKLPEK